MTLLEKVFWEGLKRDVVPKPAAIRIHVSFPLNIV